jgi:formylmethanofuran dehydrogenase subunit E
MDTLEAQFDLISILSDESSLKPLLAAAASRHRHLCPRQVLGVRIGLAGAAALGLAVPRKDKRLVVIAETDGCFLDGLEAACGTSPGSRTMRIVDYGKVAAAFVDVKTGQAVRVAPRLDIRQKAHLYAPLETRRYYAMLSGYQNMPDHELVSIQPIQLETPVSVLVGRPGQRINCDRCGEEIINQREVEQDGLLLCLPCAGDAYYQNS